MRLFGIEFVWDVTEVASESEETPGFLARATAVLSGFKTIITAVSLGVMGVADQFDVVDIMTNVRAMFSDNAKVGAVLAIVAVVFLILRAVTKGPIAAKAAAVDEGE